MELPFLGSCLLMSLKAYVAMSRSTGLPGLQVINFKAMLFDIFTIIFSLSVYLPSSICRVRAHPRVLAWHKNMLLEEEMDEEEAVTSYFSHSDL
ncbi:hypothetical protein K439DRAFT_621125 [Ramaria rubella]|nr:hypothetical protein K439DRAFT_621125 [Ramaria rubella]